MRHGSLGAITSTSTYNYDGRRPYAVNTGLQQILSYHPTTANTTFLYLTDIFMIFLYHEPFCQLRYFLQILHVRAVLKSVHL